MTEPLGTLSAIKSGFNFVVMFTILAIAGVLASTIVAIGVVIFRAITGW